MELSRYGASKNWQEEKIELSRYGGQVGITSGEEYKGINIWSR